MVEMNYKPIIILAILLSTFALLGCTQTTQTDASIVQAQSQVIDNNFVSSLQPSKVTKVEVYHFHRTAQCTSCITVGKYAEETINAYFAKQLMDGNIIFGHINIQLPENEALASKYGATGSSLMIGVYDEKGFHAEQNSNVWYKTGNKQEYMLYLKGVIEKRLAGDFS